MFVCMSNCKLYRTTKKEELKVFEKMGVGEKAKIRNQIYLNI